MAEKWLIELNLAAVAVVILVLAMFLSWWGYEENYTNEDNNDEIAYETQYKLSEMEATLRITEDGNTSKESITVSYDNSSFEEEMENTAKTFNILSYIGYGAVIAGVLYIVFILLPGLNVFKFEKGTIISVALLAAFLCFTGPIFLMVQLPKALEHDLTTGEEDDEESDMDSPTKSFWGSEEYSDGDEKTELTWGADIGWYLFVVAGVIQAISMVTVALNKTTYFSRKNASQPGFQPTIQQGPPTPQQTQTFQTMQQYGTPTPPPTLPQTPSPQQAAQGQPPQMPGSPHPQAQHYHQTSPGGLSQPPQVPQDAGNQVQCKACGNILVIPQGMEHLKMGCPKCGTEIQP